MSTEREEWTAGESALAVALHDAACSDRTCEPQVFANELGRARRLLASDWLAANNAAVEAAVREADVIRCLDRDDRTHENRCDRPAVAVVWGTLYSRAQVGPKCEEHLTERHPNLGSLRPFPFNGSDAIVFLPAELDARRPTPTEGAPS